MSSIIEKSWISFHQDWIGQVINIFSLLFVPCCSKMDVPAFAYPNLSLGRTFNIKTSTPGIDLFEKVVRQQPRNVSQYTFQYKVIKNTSDVKELLNISGDLSLKIKANILKVGGSAKYLNESKKKEGVTEVLAVMKCTTVGFFVYVCRFFV